MSNRIVDMGASVFHVARINRFRDTYNPLRGLTMQKVASLLEDGERGAYADLAWTYRFIEKRDATLRGGKRKLIDGVQEMDWNILTVPEDELPDGATAAMADAQKKSLRAAYERIENLREAIGFLALAEFRGFAHLEKIPFLGGSDDGAIKELRPVEQWHWVRDGRNGRWEYNPDALPGRIRGTEVPLQKFVVWEVEDPIDEIALIAFVRKNLSQKDWDGFVEVFGIPALFAELPEHVPEGKQGEYQEVIDQVIGDARGTLPAGAKIHSVGSDVRGNHPFRDHLRYQDEQIVMAITSGMLTMLAESGSGTLAGGAHQQGFDLVARALARRISEVMRIHLDAEVLRVHHEGQPALAWFELAANEETDAGEVVDDIAKLSTAGYLVDADQVHEKTGYNVTPAPRPVAQAGPGSFAFNRRASEDEAAVEEDLTKNAAGELRVARLGAMQPVIERIREIVEGPDEDVVSKLRELAGDIPRLADEVGADEKTVDAWNRILGAAMATGVTDDEEEDDE